jgi:hypothetical protein
VYLAHDLKHDRDVAIKVLHPELGTASGSRSLQAETLRARHHARRSPYDIHSYSRLTGRSNGRTTQGNR